MSSSDHVRSARSAIDLMKAWLDCPEGAPPDGMIECLRSKVEQHPTGDGFVGAIELIMGLVRLTGSLLVMRELETGVPDWETLMDLASEWASDADILG